MNGIVVLNYNDWRTTTNFVQRVKSYSSLNHIVVVDNCSSDESWENLKSLSDEKISIIKSDENRGYAAGNNCGIRYLRKKFPEVKNVIISNPDIYVADNDIKLLLHKLDEGYGMSTGLIHNYNSKHGTKSLASNFCWRVPRYNDLIWNHLLLIYKVRRNIFKNSIYINLADYIDQKCIDTECVPGCFFTISMNALDTIGDFDEDTFLFSEESILGYRLKNFGYKVCVLPEVEILHEQSTSINKSIKNSKKKEQIRLDSECLYLKKYLKKTKFWISIYVFIFWIGFYEKRIYGRVSKGIKHTCV